MEVSTPKTEGKLMHHALCINSINQIAVLQHQFNMMDLAILILRSRNTKIVKYIFLMSNVSAEKRVINVNSSHLIVNYLCSTNY